MNRTELNELGEFGLIERLTTDFPIHNASSIKGIGDDAAIVDSGDMLTVLSTDLLTEGVHFDLTYVPLKHLGYKSVMVNLSDIYAMNARPKQVLVSMAVSNRFSVEALEELYEGIRVACKQFKVDLVGGDTTTSPKGLTLSITAVGEVAKDRVVYRNGARVGDLLCVTGDLGGAYMGLQLLEREKNVFLENPGVQPDLQNRAHIVGRQLKPEARYDIIELFEQAKLQPTSMIDISDGLASEVFHICKASGVGALVDESCVPIHPETFDQALEFHLDPITCALHGGEDYELLFTIDPKDVEKIRFMLDVRVIGDIVPQEDGIRLQTKGGNFHPLKAQGWTHF